MSRIAPCLVKGITSVQGSYESVYGKIACDFSCENGLICAKIQVPENTTLGELLQNPAAQKLFMEEAPELSNSGFIRFFASGMPIVKIHKTLQENCATDYL